MHPEANKSDDCATCEASVTASTKNADTASSRRVAMRPQLSERNERGIAVIMVVVALALILPFVTDFGYKTNVDWQASVNQGDEIRARNAQRGAMRLSILMFELQRMVFNKKQFREFVGNIDITQVAPYMMWIFGSKEGLQDLGAMAGLNTSALGDISLGEGMGFEVRVEAESGRLNVNCLAKEPRQGDRDHAQERTALALTALMSPLLYEPLFDEEKTDGQPYRRPDVLAAIVDYVDDDRTSFSPDTLKPGGGNENYRYTQLFDPYQARNARLDSVDELHLVQGIDDDWMAAFSPYLTAWGECKVNLNFAPPELLAMVIASTVVEEDKSKVEGENFYVNAMRLANFIVDSRQFSLFKDISEFVELVEHPDQFMSPMSMLMQQSSSAQAEAESERQQLAMYVPPGVKLRLDGSKKTDGKSGSKSDGEGLPGLKDIATVAPEHTYRLEITTSAGAVRKRLTAIYELNFARTQKAGKGAWLYARED